MVDVFDQVEEELRSDRYKRLARTWLPVAGGVLLVALIAALAWWGWQKMETSKAAKASIAYERGLESLESDNLVGAEAAFVQAAGDRQPGAGQPLVSIGAKLLLDLIEDINHGYVAPKVAENPTGRTLETRSPRRNAGFTGKPAFSRSRSRLRQENGGP